MIKQELRDLYLRKRKSLSREEIEAQSRLIFEKLILQFNPIENQKVHCFLSIKHLREVQTDFFIKYCFEKKIQVFVPKIEGNNMHSIELTKETELVQNQWKILEPTGKEYVTVNKYDIVITPLLYCDVEGHRVGYGKGYYDSFFLSVMKENPLVKKVGINFFNPFEKIEDIRNEDIPLDYLVTPSEIFSFSK